MQAKCLESFGILPGGRWVRRIYPLPSITFLMFPTKLSEFLASVLRYVCVCCVKIANTGPRPGHDYVLRDAGPTPEPGPENIPHHLNGSHNIRSSHYRLTEALL